MGLIHRSSVFAGSACMLMVLVFFYCVGLVQSGGSFVIEWSMVSISMGFSFPLIFDEFSLLFSVVVLLISFFIMLFSVSYMNSELNLSRFVWLVMLFVISMNFLVFVPSMVGIIVGWDGLGLISFLLVVYYQNKKSLGAGMVTAFMNRLGDALLLVSVAILSVCGHWNLWGWGSKEVLVYVVVFVVILSTTKSAQFPFSYWLPSAMSAPTPVSALVHSSTLVTAGVFLLIRVMPNFNGVGGLGGSWLLVVSVFTTCMSGVSAFFELDMKKIVALSTLSQLGVMMFSLSLGYCSLAFFHLMSHAMFKAMLFVSVGCVIHSHGDWQDFRSVGGLWNSMPLVGGCIMLANLALSGLPFLGGFYSKDLIVESMLMGGVNFFLLVVMGLGLMMTFLYSMRLYLKGVCGGFSFGVIHSSESLCYYEVVPMVCLGLGSTFGGYFLQSLVLGFNELFVLEVSFKSFMAFLLLFSAVVVIFNLVVSTSKFSWESLSYGFFVSFFSTMWFSSCGVMLVNYGLLGLSQQSYSAVDLGWNEFVFGGIGVYDYVLMASNWVLVMWRGVLNCCLLGSMVLLVLIVVWVGL